MDLSFPGQRTATATLCILYDSVLYMPGPRVGKSENGFLRWDTWLQISQNDSKICEAEVTLIPLINKICKPCTKFKGDTSKRTKRLLYHFTEICVGPLLLSTNPLTLQTSVIYFFCSLKHEKEGECGDLPAMGIPTEPKDELSITYSYSVSFMVSLPTLLFFLLSLSLEEQN